MVGYIASLRVFPLFPVFVLLTDWLLIIYVMQVGEEVSKMTTEDGCKQTPTTKSVRYKKQLAISYKS
jgi:hypothetical protein